VKLHGCWFLQKYLSENIFLLKEIQLIGKIRQAAFAETIAVSLLNVSPLLICQFYRVTLAMSNISNRTVKHRFASLAAFCFMQTHLLQFYS
jgi:hypothetical protein